MAVVLALLFWVTCAFAVVASLGSLAASESETVSAQSTDLLASTAAAFVLASAFLYGVFTNRSQALLLLAWAASSALCGVAYLSTLWSDGVPSVTVAPPVAAIVFGGLAVGLVAIPLAPSRDE